MESSGQINNAGVWFQISKQTNTLLHCSIISTYIITKKNRVHKIVNISQEAMPCMTYYLSIHYKICIFAEQKSRFYTVKVYISHYKTADIKNENQCLCNTKEWVL